MDNIEIVLQERKRMYYKLYAKQYFEKHAEQVLKYRKEYYLNNIERLTEAYKQRYLRKKGNQPVRAYNSKRNADNKVNQPIPLRIVDEIVVTFS